MIVSSGEFQRQFGRFREIAQREPVTVTSHGRESVVLLAASEYEKYLRMKKSNREVLLTSEIPEDELRAFQEIGIPPETMQFNDEIEDE